MLMRHCAGLFHPVMMMLCLVLSAASVRADCRQTVTILGQAIDDKTRQPVANAEVCLEEICDPPCTTRPWACGLCVRTDTLGVFSITRTCTIPDQKPHVTDFCLVISSQGHFERTECRQLHLPEPCADSQDLRLPVKFARIRLQPATSREREEQRSFFQPGFRLAQDCPNPLYPTAEISVRLSIPAEVKLEILDLAGRVLTTIAAGDLRAGRHTFRWEASAYASGVYMCTLTTGKFTQTRLLLLLK